MHISSTSSALSRQMYRLLLLSVGHVTAQNSMLGHHDLDSTSCSLASVTTRADAVDAVCCDAADGERDQCVDGVPHSCDFDCSDVF
eukprot:SAG11_NODE_23844_length_382_cov_1.067138_1_plen_85_part_01